LSTKIIVSYMVKLLRYESYHNFVPEGTQDDGAYVAQFTDIYMSGWRTAPIPGIHAAGKKILSYRNVRSMDNTTSDYNEAWALKSDTGELVTERGYPQNIVADPASKGWISFLIGWVQRRANEGFDGVFLDNSLDPYVPYEYNLSARPINPRTGKYYTDNDWVRDRVILANLIKAAFPSMIFITNGIWSGDFYYRHKAGFDYALANMTIDGILTEGLYTNIEGLIWPESVWIQSVNLVKELQTRWINKGKMMVFYSQAKNGATYNSIPVEQMAGLIFGSTLLGVSNLPNNYVCCHNGMSLPRTQGMYKIDLGNPTGDYYKLEGTRLYARNFSKATVIVNPSSFDQTLSDGTVIPRYSSQFIIPTPTPSVALPVIMIGAGLTMNNPLIGIPILLTGAGLYYLQRRG